MTLELRRPSRPPTVRRALLLVLLGALTGGGALAQDTAHPVIAGYGAVQAADGAANRPDPALRYRVVFEVTRAASDPAQVDPALERLARFVNLLGASGVHPKPGDVVAVVYGAATPSILTDGAYQARYRRTNPNTPLIQALRRAGVEIHVCSYAMSHEKVARDEVASGVQVDVAAMVTLANLQLRGWAVIEG